MPEWLQKMQEKMLNKFSSWGQKVNEWAARTGQKVSDVMQKGTEAVNSFGDNMSKTVGDIGAKALELGKGIPEDVTKNAMQENLGTAKAARNQALGARNKAQQETQAPSWDEWRDSQTSTPSYTQKMTEYNDKMAESANNNKFNQKVREVGKNIGDQLVQSATDTWHDIQKNGTTTLEKAASNIAGGIANAAGNALANSIGGTDPSGAATGMRNIAALYETQEAPAYQMAAQQNQAEANRNYRSEAEKDTNANLANQQAQSKAGMSAAAGAATAAVATPAVAQADYAGKKQIQLQQRQQAVNNMQRQFEAMRHAAQQRVAANQQDYWSGVRQRRNNETAALALGLTPNGEASQENDAQQSADDYIKLLQKKYGYTVDEKGNLVPPTEGGV